jgi:methanogenic corrinoid protein MtbC1
MAGHNDLAAEILETSAAGFAAAALSELRPSAAAGPPAGDSATWRTHLTQRVLELAAAVRIEQPVLFANRIEWLRRAARARGTGEGELKRALVSLSAAVRRELPVNLEGAVAPSLDLALAAFESEPPAAARALDAETPSHRIALRYLALCLEGKPHAAVELVLGELDRGLSPATIYSDVLIAAQKEIGELWHVGDVSIAEEHLVSETTRELMTRIVAKRAPAEPVGPSLVAASVSGNAHDLGLRAVTDLFRLAGWRALFLGTNVPAEEIARAAAAYEVELVVLNATLATQLHALGEAIRAIRRLAPRCKVLVGGLAFEGLPDLWRQLGADGHAPTIDAAVALGATLAARVR